MPFTKYKQFFIGLATFAIVVLGVGGGIAPAQPVGKAMACPPGTCQAACPDGVQVDSRSQPGKTDCHLTLATVAVNVDGPVTSKHQCGSGKGKIITTINFGCYGEACTKGAQSDYCSSDHSAAIDLIFAIIRFMTYGVGLIVVASIIIAGIQYTVSGGDPKATAAAETRIRSSVVALLLFIFAYAILNYVIPAGFFGQ